MTNMNDTYNVYLSLNLNRLMKDFYHLGHEETMIETMKIYQKYMKQSVKCTQMTKTDIKSDVFLQ